MVERAHLPAERILVIPNGVDTRPFSLRRGGFREREGIPADRTVITTVGRLDTQKGLPYLLEAARLVTRGRPDLRFLVVGEGPRRRDLLRHRDRLGLKGHVSFLGFRTDIPQILADSDIFVLPSLWEGMPIVLLEALAAGLPAVATDVPGVTEVLTDGETGLVVPPKDAGALARALRELLDDPALRRRFAQAGRRRVAEDFGWEKVVATTMALYERLLQEVAPQRTP
jgi:glycosyltransferase involved in cell wall biosynthesis